MFHGSCRRVSRVLSLAFEPISKSTVHELSRKFSSTVKVSPYPKFRRCIAVDETKLKVKGAIIYVWSAVDVGSGELSALDASYSRSCLNALLFIKKALRLCLNKPRIRGPWYVWAIQRLGLDYECQRFGMRNRVERFFRYLKERTAVFHNKLSARLYAGNNQPKPIPQTIHTILPGHEGWRWLTMLIRTLPLWVSITLISSQCNVVIGDIIGQLFNYFCPEASKGNP
ncbi:MAG: DDE-type integrase/transposase/recombinase [Candidatus Caldarchaeum sp.]